MEYKPFASLGLPLSILYFFLFIRIGGTQNTSHVKTVKKYVFYRKAFILAYEGLNPYVCLVYIHVYYGY